MLARLPVLIGFLGIVLLSHTVSAGLVVTEILYDPTQGGEWIEIFNSDPVNSLDLADFEFEIGGGNAFSLSGTLGPNEYAIIYERVAGTVLSDADFASHWSQLPLATTQLFGVDGTSLLGFAAPWRSMGDPLGVDALAVVYNSSVSAEFIGLKSPPWPTARPGQSIYLTDLQADFRDPGSWAASPEILPEGYLQGTSTAAEASFASPGFFPSLSAVPEPNSVVIFSVAMGLGLVPRRRRSPAAMTSRTDE